MRYAFGTEPRLIVNTGDFRTGVDPGRGHLPTLGSVQVVMMPSVGGSLIVDMNEEQWLEGMRHLAANGLVPIAELALPSIGGDEDPGKLADDFARGAVRDLMTSGEIEAPENHALWTHVRRIAGQSFFVGWFAHAGKR